MGLKTAIPEVFIHGVFSEMVYGVSKKSEWQSRLSKNDLFRIFKNKHSE